MLRETRPRIRALVALSIAAFASGPARGEPLSKDACDAAQVEHEALVRTGVPETLKQGPAWAIANLDPAKVKEVERYIALDEELLFRCNHAKIRALAAAEAAATETASTPKATKDALKSGALPPVPRRKPQIAGAVPAQAGPASKAQAKPVVKARSKPKPKVDDAYRPPPKKVQPARE